jgi:DNA (cytosine-5)-methyltransferase 1
MVQQLKLPEGNLLQSTLPADSNKLQVAALFAGIGGIETGLHRAGHETVFFCEVDPAAQAVLKAHFPECTVYPDVTKLGRLPEVDLITAGFPCQDLSQAGGKTGIGGDKSGLVVNLFRLLSERNTEKPPKWLLFENVSYMLSLDSGRAMSFLTESLESLGYTWAYRIVDARSFGVPQRRPRVLLLASRTEDPREVLFADEYGSLPVEDRLYHVEPHFWYGFYWTEGFRGVGWAESAVPPIKGGSGLGIPSPPAVWIPETGLIGTIDIRDAERLQGLPVDWTEAAIASSGIKKSARWKVIGNAVCAPVAQWIGERLKSPATPVSTWKKRTGTDKWPKAAWGNKGSVYEVDASMWPISTPYRHLSDFLEYPLKPLSYKATAGYYQRALKCPYRLSDWFLDDVKKHLDKMQKSRDV